MYLMPAAPRPPASDAPSRPMPDVSSAPWLAQVRPRTAQRPMAQLPPRRTWMGPLAQRVGRHPAPPPIQPDRHLRARLRSRRLLASAARGPGSGGSRRPRDSVRSPAEWPNPAHSVRLRARRRSPRPRRAGLAGRHPWRASRLRLARRPACRRMVIPQRQASWFVPAGRQTRSQRAPPPVRPDPTQWPRYQAVSGLPTPGRWPQWSEPSADPNLPRRTTARPRPARPGAHRRARHQHRAIVAGCCANLGQRLCQQTPTLSRTRPPTCHRTSTPKRWTRRRPNPPATPQ